MSSLCQVLRRTVQVRGKRVATCFADRERTWEELGERVARLGGALRGLGVGEGDRVAILALNSDRYYEYYFAVSWAGAVFVPINTRLAPVEIVYWLNDSESSVLFIDETFLAPLAAIEGQLATLQTRIYMGEGSPPEGFIAYEQLIQTSEPVEASSRGGDDLAGLFYTGGTTGRSKGVMLSHRGLTLNPLQAHPILQFIPEDVCLHALPMFHIAAGFVCMTAATFGVRNVFIPAFHPQQVLETIQHERITQAALVPTMMNMVVHHPAIEHYDLSSLRRVLYGASPMPEAVISRAMALIPHATFVQAYAQTETSPVMTLLGPEYHTTEGPYAGKLASAGCAVPGLDLAILDAEGHEVPRRRIGEICVRGDNVMLGYWKLPEITAETVRAGWLHTGDSGYMDEEGFVFIVDRVKDMIISGGENVYSTEVENAIYQHEAVAECAVIGIPHDTWGEQVHAVVRCKEGQALSEEEVITHCRRLIAAFKCPRSVEFVTAPLPLSGAGKILKRELRKPYWEGQERNVH
jgi:long-chain acyl-CoA synthetase